MNRTESDVLPGFDLGCGVWGAGFRVEATTLKPGPHGPQSGSKSSFRIALICTTIHKILASASRNQQLEKDDLIGVGSTVRSRGCDKARGAEQLVHLRS